MTRISFAPLEPRAVVFLSDRTGIDYSAFDFSEPQWFSVTVREQGSVLAVLIGEFTSHFEVHLTSAIDNPKFMTRRLLHAIFSTCFSRAVRVTCYCTPDNAKSIRAIRHLGFKFEGGPLRKAIEGKWDALVFGMLREECRWIRSRKVAPSLSVLDAANVNGMNAEPLSKNDSGFVGRPDGPHISNGQFGIGVNSGMLGRSVPPLQSDSHVITPRLPLQMTGIDAAEMAVVAEVSGFGFGERSRPVDFFANKPGDEVGSPVKSKNGVSSLVSGMGPKQASGIVETKNGFSEKPFGLAIEGSPAERVAMPSPTIPVHPAPTLGSDEFETAVNFANGAHVNNNANIDLSRQ